MHVAMMLYAGFRLLEVTGPMDVFHEANRLGGVTVYEQHLVGLSSGPVRCSNGVAVGTTECLSNVDAAFDIVVVPGCPIIAPEHEHRELVEWLRDAGRRVRRLASVSNGASLIVRAGLVNEGNRYGSSGVGGGIQMALDLVAEDLGDAFAASVRTSLSKGRSFRSPVLLSRRAA